MTQVKVIKCYLLTSSVLEVQKSNGENGAEKKGHILICGEYISKIKLHFPKGLDVGMNK